MIFDLERLLFWLHLFCFLRDYLNQKQNMSLFWSKIFEAGLPFLNIVPSKDGKAWE